MDKELLEFMIKAALRIGVPPDTLTGAHDADEVREIMEQWQRYKKLEEYDRNRIKAGMKPLRTKVMHRVSESDED